MATKLQDLLFSFLLSHIILIFLLLITFSCLLIQNLNSGLYAFVLHIICIFVLQGKDRFNVGITCSPTPFPCLLEIKCILTKLTLANNTWAQLLNAALAS